MTTSTTPDSGGTPTATATAEATAAATATAETTATATAEATAPKAAPPSRPVSQKSNKPIVWGLFAAGGTVAAFVIPAMILVTGLLVPLGIISPDAMSYETMTALVGNWIVKIGLLGILILSLWHAAHRLRITAHDFGIRNDSTITVAVYGLAGLFSLAALFAVLSI